MAGLFRRITERIFTSKSTPKQTATQAKQVRDREYGGDTKRMAAAYGVTPRTVQRWIDGSRKNPPKAAAARLEQEAAKVQTTERGRERKAKQIGQQPTGSVRVRVDRAFNFAVRGSDAVRPRTIDLALTPEQAAALARASNDAEAAAAVESALLDYFNGGAYVGFGRGDIQFDPSAVEVL